MRKQPNFLDDITNRAPQANEVPITQRAAVNQDFSARRRKQMVDKFERGGFSGSAAAEEHKSFAALNFEG